MTIVKISFETPKGKYKLFATDEQLKSILCDDLFTATNVDAKTGDIINHGKAIEKALGLLGDTEANEPA